MLPEGRTILRSGMLIRIKRAVGCEKAISPLCVFFTGNFLYDPISHLPVCILEEEAFKRYFHHSLEEFIKKYETDKIRLIPYRSIGKEGGIMTAIFVSDLKIVEEKRRIEVPHAVIAVSKVSLSKWGQYEILLHPDLIKNGR